MFDPTTFIEVCGIDVVLTAVMCLRLMHVLNRYGKHIWEKMWRSWVWVRRNRAQDYEWFVKVDDDCFFFAENLRWYTRARGFSPLDAHYFGHKL